MLVSPSATLELNSNKPLTLLRVGNPKVGNSEVELLIRPSASGASEPLSLNVNVSFPIDKESKVNRNLCELFVGSPKSRRLI